MGEETLDVLSEEAIRVYLMYYDQLRKLFTQYMHLNLNAKKKVVGWRDIEDKNQSMAVSAFLKLCRCNHLLPGTLNVESLHTFIEQTIPPITQKEYEYLIEKKVLLRIYNEDTNPQQTTCEPIEGEPGLLFHEFIFLLGLIAVNHMETSSLISQKIEDFFIEKLNFSKSTSMKPRESGSPKRAKTAEQAGEEDEYYDEEVDSDSDLEMDEQQRAFMEFLEQKAVEDANFTIDFEEVLFSLNYDLPMIPGVPIVQ